MDNKFRKEIEDIRLAVVMIGVIVIAPKLPEYVADIATVVTVAAIIFIREWPFDAAYRIWRFITRS